MIAAAYRWLGAPRGQRSSARLTPGAARGSYDLSMAQGSRFVSARCRIPVGIAVIVLLGANVAGCAGIPKEINASDACRNFLDATDRFPVQQAFNPGDREQLRDLLTKLDSAVPTLMKSAVAVRRADPHLSQVLSSDAGDFQALSLNTRALLTGAPNMGDKFAANFVRSFGDVDGLAPTCHATAGDEKQQRIPLAGIRSGTLIGKVVLLPQADR